MQTYTDLINQLKTVTTPKVEKMISREVIKERNRLINGYSKYKQAVKKDAFYYQLFRYEYDLEFKPPLGLEEFVENFVQWWDKDTTDAEVALICEITKASPAKCRAVQEEYARIRNGDDDDE
jgi:hypothetical protein